MGYYYKVFFTDGTSDDFNQGCNYIDYSNANVCIFSLARYDKKALLKTFKTLAVIPYSAIRSIKEIETRY